MRNPLSGLSMSPFSPSQKFKNVWIAMTSWFPEMSKYVKSHYDPWPYSLCPAGHWESLNILSILIRTQYIVDIQYMSITYDENEGYTHNDLIQYHMLLERENIITHLLCGTIAIFTQYKMKHCLSCDTFIVSRFYSII